MTMSLHWVITNVHHLSCKQEGPFVMLFILLLYAGPCVQLRELIEDICLPSKCSIAHLVKVA
jgi:hypothetical protein